MDGLSKDGFYTVPHELVMRRCVFSEDGLTIPRQHQRAVSPDGWISSRHHRRFLRRYLLEVSNDEVRAIREAPNAQAVKKIRAACRELRRQQLIQGQACIDKLVEQIQEELPSRTIDAWLRRFFLATEGGIYRRSRWDEVVVLLAGGRPVVRRLREDLTRRFYAQVHDVYKDRAESTTPAIARLDMAPTHSSDREKICA